MHMCTPTSPLLVFCIVTFKNSFGKQQEMKNKEAKVKHVTEHYAADLSANQPKTQLQVFSQTAASEFDKRANIANVIELVKDLSPAQQEYSRFSLIQMPVASTN